MKRSPVSLEDVPSDPTFRWRVLFGVAAAIAVASILGNIALGAVLGNFLAMRSQRDSAKEESRAAVAQQAEAEALKKKAEDVVKGKDDELEELRRRNAELSANLGRAAAAEQKAKRQVADAATDSTSLPVLNEREVLRRLGPLRVLADVSESASGLGIRDGMVAEEAKSSARKVGIDSDDSAPDRIVIRVSGVADKQGTGMWMIQVSVTQRWRVPGTDGSLNVTVYEDGAVIETQGSDFLASVLSGVARVTQRVCGKINSSKK